MNKWINRFFFPLVLLLYPLRHINWGVDLWDTGYNFTNFTYAGLEHMDGMWFFSTYLSNLVGHVLTLLPGGQTLLFMNLYTGLLIGLLAVLVYYFMTVFVKIPSALVFLGEFVAVSLCWCPAAVLYNYLTYLFFATGVILLYLGLVKDRTLFLVLAGCALGLNVFVRFSNLPQAGIVVTLWAYGIICRKKIGKVIKETLFCMAGYFFVICTILFVIACKYGISSYAEGIKRLFAMTDSATDYKASAMILGMFQEYGKNLYWMNRLLFFLVLGFVMCLFLPGKFLRLKRILCAVIALGGGVWLYARGFCSQDFTTYVSMQRPAVLFLILSLFITALQILRPGVPKEEKLLAGLIMLVVLITSLGSNNALFSSINNLFLVTPYVFYCCYRFLKTKDEIKAPVLKSLNVFMPKCILVLLLFVFIYQSIGFGTGFVFVEAQGVRNVDTKIENNAILKGMYTNKERAEELSTLSDYVFQNQLSGKEVLLYGQIPALSFYLKMPPAINPWSDLLSYQYIYMEQAISQLENELTLGKDMPIVILESSKLNLPGDPKLTLLNDFMEKYDYTLSFSNTKFALFEAGKKDYD